MKHRSDSDRKDFAIIRLEQIYPLPIDEIRAALESYPADTPVFWVQEEPRNMGAWYFMKIKWDELGLGDAWPLTGITRPESASPSTGSKNAHKLEHAELLAAATGDAPVAKVTSV